MKNVYFIILSSVSLLVIVHEVRKGKFSIKESFWWVLAGIIMLILSIFPKMIDLFADFLGVAYPPSLLFTICIIFLLFINFRNCKRISKQQQMINELEQNIVLIKGNKNNGK